MNPAEIIIKKRNGLELDFAEMQKFVMDYINKEIESSQMAALLMAVYFRGMTTRETKQLTEIYIDSGSRINFPASLPTVDKHSTGGVGDKISLMLAPIAAACGAYVPMISGRGLGHTGGTLDKLESIPGYKTDFSQQDFISLVKNNGLAIISQSRHLVPADRLIYGLRDITGTVESLPLITASIMSKKIAEGAKNLVIDLKVGSGAFMPDLISAKKLGQLLSATGKAAGQNVKVIYSNMNSPLGRYCGNSLEALEAINYLKGKSEDDIDILTRILAREMLLLCNLYSDASQADDAVSEVISSGKALEKFARMISQQNGDASVVDNPSLLPQAKHKLPVLAPASGWISQIDSRQIGYALVAIGAGRKTSLDKLDLAAGAELPCKIGCKVETGQELGFVYTSDLEKGKAACSRIAAAYSFSDQEIETENIILA